MMLQGVNKESHRGLCKHGAASTEPELIKGLLGAAGTRPCAALAQATCNCSGFCASPSCL